MAETKVRCGLIGAGAVAYMNMPGLLKHHKMDIVAVCDTNPGRADALAEKYTIPRVYYDVEDLLSDSDINSVIVSVPNVFHKKTAISSLKAGKHVFLDKPFAMNLSQAKQIAEAAKQAQKVLMVGMNHRFLPDVQKLKKIVTRGKLGQIYAVKAYWMRRQGAPKFGTWFCRKDMAGGGVMLDIGCHMG